MKTISIVRWLSILAAIALPRPAAAERAACDSLESRLLFRCGSSARSVIHWLFADRLHILRPPWMQPLSTHVR